MKKEVITREEAHRLLEVDNARLESRRDEMIEQLERIQEIYWETGESQFTHSDGIKEYTDPRVLHLREDQQVRTILEPRLQDLIELLKL